MTGWLARLHARPLSWAVWLALGGAAFALVAPGLAEYVARGEVTIHWSRPLLALLLLVVASGHALAGVIAAGNQDIDELRQISRERHPADFTPRVPGEHDYRQARGRADLA